MKLDYEIKIDEEELKLTLTILEQDERFLKKEDDKRWTSIQYNCKNGFIIRSNKCVCIFDDNEIYLKGYEGSANFDYFIFKTLKKLNEYKEKLIEALEEFKSYEPDEINNNNDNLTKQTFTKEEIESVVCTYLGDKFTKIIMRHFE